MMTHKKSLFCRRRASGQQGFTLVEVMISAVILTVGLVGLLGVFATAIAATQSAQQDMIAKQMADEAMESIFTARNTAQVQWPMIQNVGAGTVPDGIFVTGLQPINLAGPDGMVGTADDATAGAEILRLPGKDGVVGTSDDVLLGLTNYQRSIAIAPWPGSQTLRSVTITVQYNVPGQRLPKTYVLTALISLYR